MRYVEEGTPAGALSRHPARARVQEDGPGLVTPNGQTSRLRLLRQQGGALDMPPCRSAVRGGEDIHCLVVHRTPGFRDDPPVVLVDEPQDDSAIDRQPEWSAS